MEDSLHVLDSRNAEIPNRIMKNRCGMSEMWKGCCVEETQKGRKYYGCIDNPECDFMSWQKPSKNARFVEAIWSKKETRLSAVETTAVM